MAVTQTTADGPICTTEEENKHREAQKATSLKPLIKSKINVLNSSVIVQKTFFLLDETLYLWQIKDNSDDKKKSGSFFPDMLILG